MSLINNSTVIRAVVVILALVNFSLNADDLTITFKTKTSGFLDLISSAKGEEVVYYSPQYKRTNNKAGKKDQLVDYKNFVTYEIDHKKKVITKYALNDMVAFSSQLAGEIEEESQDDFFDVFIGVSKDTSPTVTKTDGGEVLGRRCEKWKISVGGMSLTTFVDPNLVPPTPKTDIDKIGSKYDALAPIIGGKAFSEYFEAKKRINGIQLKSEERFQAVIATVKRVREATKIVVGPVPLSVFELPKGYEVVDGGEGLLQTVGDL
jgi:hypothetical protein